MDVGDVLAGRYELLGEVGVGGMGRVMRARDRTLDRIVAVKLLAPHLLGDENAVTALRDEARRAAAVRHPNVVQVLDAILDGTDQPAIVMEFVDGPTLASVVPDGGMPIEDALSVLTAVGAGLGAVHDAGLVHRDVTPSNVLLDDGVPRLTDFGIARSVAATSTQTVQGSVGYLAPEQASGAAVGPAADVYAFGCLATTLLTGRPPFTADAPVGVVHQHRHDPAPDVRTRRPEVPASVAAGIARALAKQPLERPATPAAVLGQAVTAAPIGDPAPADAATRVIAPPTGTAVLPGRERRWSPALLAVLILGTVIAAAAAMLAIADRPPQVSAVPTPSATVEPSPTPTPTPTPSASPSPEPLAPREVATVAIRDLRSLLVDLRAGDALSAEALEKLDERATEVGEKLDEDKANEVAKALREFRRELGDRVEKQEVTREAENAILAQVIVLETAIDEIPPGEGRGQDDGDDD